MRKFVPPCLLLVLSGVALGGGADSWKEYRSKENHFRALFPGEPKATTSKVKGVELKAFAVETDKNGYLVLVSDIPGAKFESEKMVEDRLDTIRNHVVKEQEAKVEKETKITLGGTLLGRDVLYTLKAGPVVRVRYFVVNGRIYQVLAYGPKDWVAGADTEKFLDSFMLTQ
jgi:hypothetical protein